MAKAKKLEKMTDAELLAPMPQVANPVGSLSAVKVDFAAQKNFLEARIQQVLSEEMSEATLERVQKLKRGVVGWRTAFKKETDEYIKAAFKSPMDVYKTAASEILAEIDTMEAKLDEVLDKEEEKRRDNLNVMFDGMEDELQEEYKLPEEYRERVERRKSYYNKTAVMSEVAADLRQQYSELAKEYKNYQLAVSTVTKMCKADKRLNLQVYIDHLRIAELPEVMEEIENETARLAALDNPSKASSDTVEVIGKPVVQEVEDTELTGITKTMTLELTYDTSLADYLTEVFRDLKSKGIKQKVLSVRENEPDIPVF